MKWPDLKPILAAVLAAVLALLGHRQFPPELDKPVPAIPVVPHTEPASDPLDALGRLVMEGGYCSATPITPLSKDRKQRLLSAAHCVKDVGEQVQFFTRAGRVVKCSVISINREADACLLVTEDLREALPYLLVADVTPEVGTKVFHAGFGRDKPGNKEAGRVLSRDVGSGQAMFELSVSPGDSGGGICLDASGRLVSPVCCTTQVDAVGQVFGSKPEVIQAMMKTPASFHTKPPMQMPVRMPVPAGK